MMEKGSYDSDPIYLIDFYGKWAWFLIYSIKLFWEEIIMYEYSLILFLLTGKCDQKKAKSNFLVPRPHGECGRAASSRNLGEMLLLLTRDEWEPIQKQLGLLASLCLKFPKIIL